MRTNMDGSADVLGIDEDGLKECWNMSQHVDELMRDYGAENLTELVLEERPPAPDDSTQT